MRLLSLLFPVDGVGQWLQMTGALKLNISLIMYKFSLAEVLFI